MVLHRRQCGRAGGCQLLFREYASFDAFHIYRNREERNSYLENFIQKQEIVDNLMQRAMYSRCDSQNTMCSAHPLSRGISPAMQNLMRASSQRSAYAEAASLVVIRYQDIRDCINKQLLDPSVCRKTDDKERSEDLHANAIA